MRATGCHLPDRGLHLDWCGQAAVLPLDRFVFCASGAVYIRSGCAARMSRPRRVKHNSRTSAYSPNCGLITTSRVDYTRLSSNRLPARIGSETIHLCSELPAARSLVRIQIRSSRRLALRAVFLLITSGRITWTISSADLRPSAHVAR
jgi:hypothetical protein